MSAPGVVVPATLPAAAWIDWRAIIAGAVVAVGVSFTLIAFGTAIGLSLASTAPTWRDSSPWLWVLSGIYLLFVALCAFGFGAYVTGRMRAGLRPLIADEIEFRGGMHGVVTWGLAILITAALALGGSLAATRLVAPSAGTAGPAASVAGENIIASELDELFRTDRRIDAADLTYRRSEAARILLKSSSHDGVSQDDRDYLADITASITGTSQADADTRVDKIIGESKDEIQRARSAAVLQAFMIAAALLIGLAVAWFAAAEGGREREAGYVPVWDWSWRRRYS
ncbi:MAG TPA: hypothetical protein VGG36_03110 [Rhizomicrobium sp.]|jgi:hypothetical protein